MKRSTFVSRALSVGALAGLSSFACTTTTTPGGCATSADCGASETCFERQCFTTCNASTDCRSDELCEQGVCRLELEVCDGSAGQPLACRGCSAAAECDDADLCTGEERCDAGRCTPGTPPACDDTDPCTTDSCEPATGCRHVEENEGRPGCTPLPCDAVPSGGSETRERYATTSVPFGETCAQETQTRSCTNGAWGGWSGTYTFDSCTVTAAADCLGPDSAPILHGDDRTYFATELAAPGDACQSEQRLCHDGELDGSFAFATCCAAETDQALCSRLGKDCGELWANDYCGVPPATDNCGVARTPQCGTCSTPSVCGGTGVPNVCGALASPPHEPQVLALHKTPSGDPTDPLAPTAYYWFPGTPTSIGQGGIDEIVAAVAPGSANPDRRLGISVSLYYLDLPDGTEDQDLERLFCLAEANDVPLFLKLDGFAYWESRSDLWNWWSPLDLDKRNNVEWTDWTADSAIKLSWRNWGCQYRVAPQPNIASPAYINAKLPQLERLLAAVVRWYEHLPPSKRYLLAGVELDSELSIGFNYYYYPNGNDRIDDPGCHNRCIPGCVDSDPFQLPDFNNRLDGGYVQVGYAALSTYGIQTSGAMTLGALNHALFLHANLLASTAESMGLPREKTFLHGVGKPFGFGAMVTPQATPGWSFYDFAYDPAAAIDGFGQPLSTSLDQLDNTWWGAVEWLYMGGNGGTPTEQWTQALRNSLGHDNLKELTVLNWENVSQVPEAVDAIRSVLTEGPSCWLDAPYVFDDVVGNTLALQWLVPASAEAVYLSVSTSSVRALSGGIPPAAFDVYNNNVTGTTSWSQSLPSGTYAWQVVADGCGSTQRRITYGRISVP